MPINVGLANAVTAVVSFITPFIAGPIVQSISYRPFFVLSLLMANCALGVSLVHGQNYKISFQIRG